MADMEKVTALKSPAATGDGQSPSQKLKPIVTDNSQKINENFVAAAVKEHPG